MNIKTEIKSWLAANIWDGEDRAGCKNDSAIFNPDELQELFEEFMKDYEDKLKARIAELEADIQDLVNNKGGSFAYNANGEAWVRLGFKIVKDSEVNHEI